MSQIIQSDVLSGLAGLPAGSFHAVMTSPPYWRLRAYPGVAPTEWSDGHVCCLGAEADPGSFVRHLVEVFAGVWRVLRSDGVLFVNIGETYATDAGSCRKPGDSQFGKSNQVIDSGNYPTARHNGSQLASIGLKPGDRCGIPERFALAMQAAGWYWRDTIIWAKRSPMPSSQTGWRWIRCRVKTESSRRGNGKHNGDSGLKPHAARDGATFASGTKWTECPGCPKCLPNDGYVLRQGRFRTTAAHEPVFVFAKGERYFMDDRAAAEEAVGGTPGNKRHKAKEAYEAGDRHHRKAAGLASMVAMDSRNPRSWWPLSSEPLKEKHFAAFPTALVKKCLEMATSKAGCCSVCGSPWAPIVESERVPTRPGDGSKLSVGFPANWAKGPGNHSSIAHNQDGVHRKSLAVGNRDPQRHITVTRAIGYRPTCRCQPAESVPCRVLDPFLGSGTVGQVANALGLDWAGIEASSQYVEIAIRRVLVPLRKEKSRGKKRHKRPIAARTLFE